MRNLLIFALLVLPAVIFTIDNGHTKYMAFAQDEDELEDDMEVENDEQGVVDQGGDENETEEESETSSSPDADTYLLFTRPSYVSGVQMNLPGGQPVEFLVGFQNKGAGDFLVETVEASFRYPMDFNYYIQNFSAIAYNREVKSGHEATVSYAFLPSEQFAGRPFGLNIALSYRDANGLQFTESVFNETVNIIELDEGLDGETFFLYIFLAAFVILLLVLGQQFLVGSVGKKRRHAPARKVETGTNNPNNIDFEWLPEETIRALQKTPNSKSPKKAEKKSPKSNETSPRQRKAQRAAGSDD